MKNASNFFISAILLGLLFGGAYYYFETHSMLDSTALTVKYRKWISYLIYYAIAVGIITSLFVIVNKKGTNTFWFWNTLQLNFSFSFSIFYYMYYYGTLFMRGKVLLYCVAVIAIFILQTILLVTIRKNKTLNP